MKNKLIRKKIWVYLRLIFGIFLLLLLIRMIDMEQMRIIITSAVPHLIILGFLGILLNCLLMTYRWASILWIQQPDISFGHLMRFYFTSAFLGNFLPVNVSSDIFRIYCASKYTCDIKGSISSILVDRIIGTFSLAIVTMIAFMALQKTNQIKIGLATSYSIFAVLLCSILIPLALRQAIVIDVIRNLLSRFEGRLFKKARDMLENILMYQYQHQVIVKVLLISFLSHLNTILVYYIIAESFSANTSIGYFFLFIPLTSFLTMLPLSVGGIGVLEAGMVFLFSKVGMPIEMCLSIAISYRVLLIIATLPGGVVYAIKGFPAKKYNL
ncbi:MAG: lysylphosphatidylglycerol synthase transmembrane domain-containing protein [Nitrospirota bacterium]